MVSSSLPMTTPFVYLIVIPFKMSIFDGVQFCGIFLIWRSWQFMKLENNECNLVKVPLLTDKKLVIKSSYSFFPTGITQKVRDKTCDFDKLTFWYHLLNNCIHTILPAKNKRRQFFRQWSLTNANASQNLVDGMVRA